jgi:biotin transport system substrate-specific component
MIVLLTGLVLGRRWGLTSVIIWVLLGLFGLPVFAQGKAGIAVLVGPTGGFLLGFVLCAYLTGWLMERSDLTYKKVLVIMFIGLMIIYAVGFLGFMISFEYFLHKPMTWNKAVALSVTPFLPFDAIKAILAAYLGIKVRRALLKAGLY